MVKGEACLYHQEGFKQIAIDHFITIVFSYRLLLVLGAFKCPDFFVSDGSFQTCDIGGLCGGDRLTAGVCSTTGGSFTGGTRVNIYL